MRINPKNFFDRQLDHLPPHFIKMVIERRHEADIEPVRHWIYQNCSGRFTITKDVKLDGDKLATVNLVVWISSEQIKLFVDLHN